MSFPVIKGILQSSENHLWNTADSLGRGATAVVYLGRQKQHGKVVAVKVFHDHIHWVSGCDEIRELELLQKLKHENIVKLFAIERESQSKRPVVVMEYCEGGSLYHMLDQPQHSYGLPEDQFVLVLQHVSAGIEYLRRLQIIHRDIKPGNIMRFVTEDGRSIYKLTDFGAARELNEEQNFTSMYGTEEYLHPGMYEKAVLRQSSGQRFDAKVDLWSLGVTFYHVATGKLPFQPYGGRTNKQTMFTITSQKEYGVISGVQNFENGPIIWSRELPQSCQLSSGMKALVVPLLAGLMECDESRVITYDVLFRVVQTIAQKITFTIFHYTSCRELKIFIDKNESFSTLQDILASQTDICARDQLLLIDGKPMENLVDMTATVDSYPIHIRDSHIFLFQRDLRFIESERVIHPEIPHIPEFVNFVDMEKDLRLSHSCSARGHLIKRYTDETLRKQKFLSEGLVCIRSYIHTRLDNSEHSAGTMEQVMKESQKRFNTFYFMVRTIKTFCDKLNIRNRDLEEISMEKTQEEVHKKAEIRMKEIITYQNTLVAKVHENCDEYNHWFVRCEQNSCFSKISHYVTVIGNIQNRFRRDKNVKDQMTSHDEHVHQCERQKLQEQCVAMTSILQDHCFCNLEIMYKEAIQFLGSLSKDLFRITKIEKNIESVIVCQQKLSLRLDKVEDKCHDVIDRLQRTIQDSGFSSENPARQTQPLTGYAEGGMDNGGNGSSSLTSAGFSASLREICDDSKSIASMILENSEMIRRLEECGLYSSGSLSTNLDQT
ncbi:serine/threonine-protein kinase TBK1-like [Gigantopelta aegis]|uniref:serine/threonine-protein kinase TBK1-like n=1 Tax=Gigantopelta aegis TaxID=1735272 RepID=UPI001B88918A|nr:serine/threonine-protein kinase TBK1-like [Gigantopelta aegis]XP_041349910.1 serine/threonine-protein kinase TBK1-like [Gigantopelta aegis]XP_041349911.1 serine/threonine-protein kinase TBK1-like [Gigantopelta aegis]